MEDFDLMPYEPPSRLNPMYFDKGGNPTELLMRMAGEIKDALRENLESYKNSIIDYITSALKTYESQSKQWKLFHSRFYISETKRLKNLLKEAGNFSLIGVYIVSSQARGDWRNFNDDKSDLDIVFYSNLKKMPYYNPFGPLTNPPIEFKSIRFQVTTAVQKKIRDFSELNKLAFFIEFNEGYPIGVAYDLLNSRWICNTEIFNSIEKLTERINSASDEKCLDASAENIEIVADLYRDRGTAYLRIRKFKEALENYEKSSTFLTRKYPDMAKEDSKRAVSRFYPRLLKLEKMGLISDKARNSSLVLQP